MIVPAGIHINNKNISLQMYTKGLSAFEKSCNEDYVSTFSMVCSSSTESLLSNLPLNLNVLLSLLDVRSEDDMKDVFSPLNRPSTVKFIDGKVMIGRKREEKELATIIIDYFKKIIENMKNGVKDQGKNVEFHILVTYPAYLSITTRKKIQSFMSRATDDFKTTWDEEKKRDNLKFEIKIESISYMTEEEAIVCGHYYTTNSLDSNLTEKSFIVCNIGDIRSSITHVHYMSPDNAECEVDRFDECSERVFIKKFLDLGVEKDELMEAVNKNPMNVRNFISYLPSTPLQIKKKCIDVVREFSQPLIEKLGLWIKAGKCDGVFVMGNCILLTNIKELLEGKFQEGTKFIELPFPQTIDHYKMCTSCALLYRIEL